MECVIEKFRLSDNLRVWLHAWIFSKKLANVIRGNDCAQIRIFEIRSRNTATKNERKFLPGFPGAAVKINYIGE